MSTTTILSGWHEAFQWQWNAALTIVGFIAADPQNDMVPRAIEAVVLAIEMCKVFGLHASVARTAGDVLEKLKHKLDTLVRREPSKPLPSAQQQAQVSTASDPNADTAWLRDVPAPPADFAGFWDVGMQDEFNMTYSIEQWSALDSLMPMFTQEV